MLVNYFEGGGSDAAAADSQFILNFLKQWNLG